MGFITDSLDPGILAGFIEKIFSDIMLREQISETNTRYARENFSLGVVIKRLENILNEVNAMSTA
jgi:glycosyltransferase involved in cell wall biosynthesis